MNVTLSDEQEQLRSVVRDFLARRAPEAEIRRLMATDTGYDPAVWDQLAGELGLVGLAVPEQYRGAACGWGGRVGLAVPEQYGGAGCGWAELGVVFEEMGRALLCAPYFATVALAIP